MKKFSEILKALQEEKIIVAKEDEGAATGGDVGGGVVNSPSTDSDAGDVVQNDGPVKTGLATTDVLGKCDHKKDGIFGPGCFHLPCIWTIPSFRIPRKKKRKKLPFSNLIKEDEGYQAFEKTVSGIIEK